MSKLLGSRNPITVAKAIFEWRHYRAAKNMLLRYRHPLDATARYLFASGDYPCTVQIKTPLGIIEPTIYSFDDMLTLNEVFCREDYRCSRGASIIVDFGSNIGISALYFLTRSPETFAYLFEPLPQNSERLHQNLRGFEDRYEFSQVAIALTDGEAEFGYESSGRYGGIGLMREKTIQVRCRSANELLREILDRCDVIDVLKIDIESLEKEILFGIPTDVLRRIKEIFIEVNPMFRANPLPQTHGFRRYGAVAHFLRRN